MACVCVCACVCNRYLVNEHQAYLAKEGSRACLVELASARVCDTGHGTAQHGSAQHSWYHGVWLLVHISE